MTQNAQAVALQLEKVKSKIALWFQADTGLYTLLKKKAGVEVVSSRNLRVPIQLDNGGAAQQVDMDGGDLGLGDSASWDVAELSPVYFAKGFSVSKLAEYATKGDGKAIESVTKNMVTDALSAMKKTLESLLNTDGSATLDTIVAVNSNVFTVNNANMFAKKQKIQVVSALGSSARGTCTITGVDANAKTITVDAAPSGSAEDDLLILVGAPRTAASSLFGLEYHNTAATTGSWLDLSRSTYPQLRSNHIDAGSTDLAPNMPRDILNSIRRRLGVDKADGIVFHANMDISAAWEALATSISEIILNQNTGDTTQDILAKHTPKTMAGRTLVESLHGVPGRLDALDLTTWGRAETVPVGLMDWEGQTIFPTYGTSGGLNAASIGYVNTGVQVYTDNPLANGFVDGITVPDNY